MITSVFVGNLGRDAQLKHTTTGTPIANFSIAVGKKDEVTWITCTLWGSRAAKILEYLKKGTKVFVVGKLKQEFYTKKDGSNGASLSVDVNEISFVGSSLKSEQQNNAYGNNNFTPNNSYPPNGSNFRNNSAPVPDDIPFMSLDEWGI